MGQPTPTELQTATPPRARRETEDHQNPPSSRGRWVWLLVLVAVGVAAYFLWPKIKAMQGTAAPAAGTGKGKKGERHPEGMPGCATPAGVGAFGEW